MYTGKILVRKLLYLDSLYIQCILGCTEILKIVTNGSIVNTKFAVESLDKNKIKKCIKKISDGLLKNGLKGIFSFFYARIEQNHQR